MDGKSESSNANELSDLKSELARIKLANKVLEDRVQQAQEKTWSGHWEMDIATKEVSWSPEMYNLLGVDVNNQPDMKLFYEKLPSISRDLLNGAIKKTFINKQDYSFEHKIEQDNKTILNARTDLKLAYDVAGKPNKLIGNTSDITAIKSTQKELERLSLIASNTTNGVVMLDLETKIQWVNQGFTLLTGYRFDEVSNTAINSMLYAHKKQLVSKEFLYEAMLNAQYLKEEVRIKSKQSEECWVLMNISPILDYELNPESYVVILSDITEQKHNEKLLHAKNQTILEQKKEVDAKNDELEIVLKQLTRAKISRKSVTITFMLAILLFVISEVVIDPQIEKYFERSQELVIGGKLVLALLLKPIEDVVRRSLYRSEIRKRVHEND